MRNAIGIVVLGLALTGMSRVEAQTAQAVADPGTPPEPPVLLKLTFTFQDPTTKDDPGGWTKSNFQEGKAWRTANTVGEIEAAVAKESAKKVWFRFQATSTKETYNNTYFASRHVGIIEVWNEGERNRSNIRNDGSRWMRYFGFIHRRDQLDVPCQYGVTYATAAGKRPRLDFAFVAEKSVQVPELRDAGGKSSQFKAVLDIPHIRDACAMRGPDGRYYMVGTPLLHGRQEGIDLYRSDSVQGPFERIGTPWTFAASKWVNPKNLRQANPKDKFFDDQIIWAPEIEYIRSLKKWAMVYFPNRAPRPHPRGFHISIALADRPEGPFKDVVDGPIAHEPDPHLFEDDDGTVYLTMGVGKIAKLKPDLSGLAEEPRVIYPRNAASVANEGTTLFKHKGVYYFGGAFTTHYWDDKGKMTSTYDCVMCSSTKGIYGPYGDRYIAIKNGGNNSYFQDGEGRWHCTVWQPTKKATIVPVELTSEGQWRPAKRYDVLKGLGY